MPLMSITVNGEPRELPDTITLEKLIEHFGLPMRLIAVEHNNQVVRRAEWPERTVADSDKIEIVHFVGGG